MAVAPTGNIFKALTFDGVSSRSYGVYITGSAVYNAPEREVEMISIPNRNGQFALDKGRFENIEVTYPAGIFADTEVDFADAISEFRNFLCSRNGYVRLQDEYNPNEYRMAIYKSGLEVEPAQLKAGEFKIKFDCKPQRFLTSGETAVTVSSGDTLTNPTLFESSPLLEVEGYGTLNINGTEVEIDDVLVGDVIAVSRYNSSTTDAVIDFSNIYMAPNDLIEVNGIVTQRTYRKASGSYSLSSAVVTSWQGEATASPTVSITDGTYITIETQFSSPISFHYGTSRTTGVTTYIRITFSNGDVYSDLLFNSIVSYDGNKEIRVTMPRYEAFYLGDARFTPSAPFIDIENILIHSTATAFGHPTYIDCDLGEAYAVDNGVISSLNSYIALGSKLPELSVGTSEITYDNTIISLKITPRWWKV